LRICIWMLVASDEAMSGSVIRKADLILPSIRGLSHWSFWASLPYLASTSMLPVSGAEQLTASEATEDLPSHSAIRPYSRLVKPGDSL
jgi:hypothetical protein